MKKTKTFNVVVFIPDGADDEDVADYIKEAVEGWCGQFEPVNPLFNIGDVKVTYRKTSPPGRRSL